MLVSRQRNTHNVGPLKDRAGHFLELIFEIRQIVTLPERGELLNRVRLWHFGHHRVFHSA